MLKRLYVDNVRCLTNFELYPDRIAALVGPNGGGKSSVFEVLRSLQAFLNGGELVESVAPQWTRTRWDSRGAQRIELECELSEEVFHYEVTATHRGSGSGVWIEEEKLTSRGDLLYRLADGMVELYGDRGGADTQTTFPFVANRSFIPMLDSRPENQRITAFKRWMSGLFLFAVNPWSIEPVSQGEATSIAIDGGNFVSWYRALVQEQPDISGRLHGDLSPIIPGLRAIRLRPVGPNARVLALECEIGGNSFDIGVHELSEGQRVLLVLYTILHAVAPRATLLVFDEPDNFVAQSEIQPWLSLLRESVTNAGQGTLLVISHHPEVIDYLAADQALYLWRSEDGPTRIRSLSTEMDLSEGLLASEWLKLGAASE
jgi:predicted ATPase